MGFGRGKVSVIINSNEEIKISDVDCDRITPIFSSSLDLASSIGRGVEHSTLFEAIMSLKGQSYSGGASDFLPGLEPESPMDLLFSPILLLVMLLKVTLRLPNLGGVKQGAMAQLLQALVQISDSSNNNSEQEGKP